MTTNTVIKIFSSSSACFWKFSRYNQFVLLITRHEPLLFLLPILLCSPGWWIQFTSLICILFGLHCVFFATPCLRNYFLPPPRAQIFNLSPWIPAGGHQSVVFFNVMWHHVRHACLLLCYMSHPRCRNLYADDWTQSWLSRCHVRDMRVVCWLSHWQAYVVDMLIFVECVTVTGVRFWLSPRDNIVETPVIVRLQGIVVLCPYFWSPRLCSVPQLPCDAETSYVYNTYIWAKYKNKVGSLHCYNIVPSRLLLYNYSVYLFVEMLGQIRIFIEVIWLYCTINVYIYIYRNSIISEKFNLFRKTAKQCRAALRCAAPRSVVSISVLLAMSSRAPSITVSRRLVALSYRVVVCLVLRHRDRLRLIRKYNNTTAFYFQSYNVPTN